MPVLKLKCVFRSFVTMQSVCTVLYSTRYLSADLEEIKQISAMLLKSFGSSINKTLGCNNLAGKLVKADAIELGHTDGKVVHYLRKSDPQAEDKKNRILGICKAKNIQIDVGQLDIYVFGSMARGAEQQGAVQSNAGRHTWGQAGGSQSSFPSIPPDNNRREGAPSGSQGPVPQVQYGKNEKGKKSPSSARMTHEAVQKMNLNSSSERNQHRSTTPPDQKNHTGRKIMQVDEWEVNVPAAEPEYEHTPPQSTGNDQYKPGWGPQMPPNHGMPSFGRKYDSGGNYLAHKYKHHKKSPSPTSLHPSKREDEILSGDAASERNTVPSHYRGSSSSSCSEALKDLNNLDLRN